MHPLVKLGVFAALGLFSSLAAAAVTLTTVAQTEVATTGKDGRKIVKRLPATRVVPGTEVIYTITAENGGAEPAGDIVVTNPVPAQTVYMDGSAAGPGTDITFSADGGQTFGQPGALVVTDAQGVSRPAMAEDYTHVRWQFRFELKPGQKAPVWYRVRVK